MPLEHSSTDAARSRNIAKLRREGYPVRQAAAIAYKEQRKMKRRRRHARSNPVGNLAHDAGIVGAAATVGALAGVVYGATTQGGMQASVNGMAFGIGAGIGAVSLYGIGQAVLSPAHRTDGLVLAGMASGAYLLTALAMWAGGVAAANLPGSAALPPPSTAAANSATPPTTPAAPVTASGAAPGAIG